MTDGDAEAPLDIGPYRLAQRIAVGGMAEVYRALAPQAAGGDRAVVIKRMLPALVGDPEQRAMFEHEAVLGRRIEHPNVVSLIDYGQDDDAPYLVLEYVFGVDLWRLARWLRQAGRRMPLGVAAFIGRELLAGLQAVHDLRDESGRPLHLVHRDVSPSNLFLSVHGEVKLGDLGIARSASPATARRGAGVRAKGKLGYLSPEQVRGDAVDQRADIFSAAVVLTELVLGRPLFAGATEISVLLAIRDGDLSALEHAKGELPMGLSDVLFAGLEPRREDRTPSADILRAALIPFVDAPPEQLRDRLGSLVVEAMDQLHGAVDRTSLAQTIEAHPSALRPRAPRPVPPPQVPQARAEAPRYEVQRLGKGRGQHTLAELVAALTTGEVEAGDLVRKGSGPFRAVGSVPELSRYLPPGTRTPTLQDAMLSEHGETIDLSGPVSIVRLLGSLRAERSTALVLCERMSVRKEVYVVDGTPAFVTSNQPRELLGQHLVARGVLEMSELNLALGLLPRYNGQLGETLVALGLMDPVELVKHLGVQVREKLLEIFEWPEGTAAIYREVRPPESAFRLNLDAWEMLEAGAARRLAAGLNPMFAQHARQRPFCRGRHAVDGLDLPDSGLAVWTACAGPRGRGELEAVMPDPSRTDAILLMLLHLGVLRWYEP